MTALAVAKWRLSSDASKMDAPMVVYCTKRELEAYQSIQSGN